MKRNLAFLLFALLFFLVGCGGKARQYSFPLSQEDLEQALVENNLHWRVVDDKPSSEDLTTFTLENDDGVKMFIGTSGGGSARHLRLAVSRYAALGKKRYLEQEMPKLVELVGQFFGNSKEASKVYKGFSRLAETKNWDMFWPKRVGDNHYYFRFGDSLVDMTIDNGDSFAKMQAIQVSSFTEEMERVGTPVKKASTADLAGIKAGIGQEEAYVIRGRLENIRQAKEAPHPELNPEELLTAVLVDSSGSLEVFLPVSTLTTKELAKERDHYLVLHRTEAPFSLIHISAPVE